MTDITPDLSFDIAKQNYSLWNPIQKDVLALNISWDLADLEDIEEIKMDKLVEKLKSMKKVNIPINPLWTDRNISIGSAVLFVLIIIALYLTYRCYKRKTNIPTRLVNRLVDMEEPSSPEAVPLQELRQRPVMVAGVMPRESVSNAHFNVYPSLQYA